MISAPDWLELVLAILATWRLARLVAFEDGPGAVVARLRRQAGSSWVGELMDCPYCLSIWFAAPLAAFVAPDLSGWLLAWLATSGGASLIQELVESEQRERVVRIIDPLGAFDAAPLNPFERDSERHTEAVAAHAAQEKSDVLLWEPSRRRQPRADQVRGTDHPDDGAAGRRDPPVRLTALPAPRPLGVPRDE